MPIIRDHDQYYTNPATADFCVQQVRALAVARQKDAFFLEPSAGAGAFLNLLPPKSRTGLDIAPAHPEVVQADFLSYTPPAELARRPVIVLGNPPFGRNSSLALKFINHAARFARVVAFILPKTFQKAHSIRRIDRHLHLVAEYPIPSYAFIFESQPWDVPCVFQIWERRDVLRQDSESIRTHADFAFVPRQEADFAIRRVGRSAGAVFREFERFAKSSHHFVKAVNPEQVMAVLESIDWSPVRGQTACVPCVGKEEIVRMYAACKAAGSALATLDRPTHSRKP